MNPQYFFEGSLRMWTKGGRNAIGVRRQAKAEDRSDVCNWGCVICIFAIVP